jgi:hypothetical protein
MSSRYEWLKAVDNVKSENVFEQMDPKNEQFRDDVEDLKDKK